MKWWLIIILCLIFHNGYSQRKKAVIKQLTDIIEIDGFLNDKAWEDATVIEDFVGYQPVSGIEPSVRTTVKVAYDKEAIYFGAMLYDNIDSIRRRLTLRDNIDADNFIFHLSPYNDGTSWFEFWTTCTGVQQDVFIEPTGRNRNWDVVWDSKVNIVDSGWIAEIKVPFNVLRVPKKTEHIWGFNMFRQVKWKNQVISWNLMNPDGPAGTYFYSTQQGELHGIKNIDPGIKLWFWPYGSIYTQRTPDKGFSKPIFQAGMEVKYGISESFDLNMILIPDFKQVRIDDKVLNLTPFEIYYDEHRQFFHEGTDLFNKAGIFYSRRIGSTPVGNKYINENTTATEEIALKTETSRIINATKITGRTEKGLGIGFLNSMIANEYAQIRDTLDGSIRNFKTQPFTNYNVIVADQTFGENSYITLINTNLIRKLLKDEESISGNHYIANVLALDTKIYTGDYATVIYGAHSYKPINNKFTSGYYYNLQFGKDKGEFRYLIKRQLYSENYDPNDMGYLKTNNEALNTLSISYNINKPFSYFLNFLNTISFSQTSQFRPNKFSDFVINHSFRTKLINQWTLRLTQNYRPIDSYDFYEPRSEGKYFTRPETYDMSFSVNTDPNKPFSFRSGLEIHWYGNNTKSRDISIPLSILVKLNDKLSFSYSLSNSAEINDRGYVNKNSETGEIYFSRRDINTIENILSALYILSPNAAFDFRARYYYSTVDYKKFFILQDDGNLDGETDYTAESFYYNALTADLSYIWRYKPGSNLSVLLRHQIYNNFKVDRSYSEALNKILGTSGITSISLRLLYYLDYNHIVKK